MANAVQSQNLTTCKPPVLIRRTTPVGTRTHKGLWLCRCGNQFEASLNNVACGHTVSCGCFKENVGRSSKHGHFVGDKPSPTYKSWQAMIARCTNPKHPAFHHYGGRGITIYEPWLKSFPEFLADVGIRPAGKTLDRYPDANGNYEPRNVRWATEEQQQRNRRNTIMASIGDVNLPVVVICERYRSSISTRTVMKRLDRGWSLFDAITKPLGERKCVFAPLGAS